MLGLMNLDLRIQAARFLRCARADDSESIYDSIIHNERGVAICQQMN